MLLAIEIKASSQSKLYTPLWFGSIQVLGDRKGKQGAIRKPISHRLQKYIYFYDAAMYRLSLALSQQS